MARGRRRKRERVRVLRERRGSGSSSITADTIEGDAVDDLPESLRACIDDRVQLTHSYGRNVYRGTFNERPCVAKHITTEEETLASALREVKIPRRLGSCPFILRARRVMYSHDKSDFVILYPWVRQGDLFEVITRTGTLSERRTRRVMRQLLSGLAEMHAQGVVHRDIKPENILYNREKRRVQIADFGLACEMSDDVSVLATRCGTKMYLSPQILGSVVDHTHAEAYEIYGQAVAAGEDPPWSWYANDVWACGLLMFILVHGYHPFQPHSECFDVALYRGLLRYIDGGVRVTVETSFDYVGLVAALLDPDEARRPSAADALEHPWFATLSRSSSGAM